MIRSDFLNEHLEVAWVYTNANGNMHSGKDAVAHIQKKYDYFIDDIKITEDFIRYSATKSKMSGKYYKIHGPNQAPIKAKIGCYRN